MDVSGTQRDIWERFYQENDRPWRGIGKIEGLEVSDGWKVLDIGCGNGKTSSALIKAGAEVTGLDFSQTAIDRCNKAYGDKGKFVCGDCTKIPFPDDSFDAVVAVHVLEHLDDDELSKTVSEISRVLVPGGTLFIRAFAVGDMRANGQDSNVRGNGIRYRYYTVEEMEHIFTGFEIVDSKRTDESTRFGTVRVKIECLFRLV